MSRNKLFFIIIHKESIFIINYLRMQIALFFKTIMSSNVVSLHKIILLILLSNKGLNAENNFVSILFSKSEVIYEDNHIIKRKKQIVSIIDSSLWHSLSSWSIDICHAQLVNYVMRHPFWYCFCQYHSPLIFRLNKWKLYSFLIKLFLDEMMIYFNMFSAIMLYRILGNLYV